MDLKKTIEGCINKDSQAVRTLYQKHSGRLYALCLRYAKSDFEAQDLLQESFIRILDNLRNFKLEDGNFEGWSYRITVNVALNYIKRELKFKHIEINEEYSQEFISPEAIQQLEFENLIELLSKLPVGQRTIFNLYVIEGYSHQEIGSMLGISETTSRSQLTRGKVMLKKLYQKHYSIGE